jgi:hypothetical protein
VPRGARLWTAILESEKAPFEKVIHIPSTKAERQET